MRIALLIFLFYLPFAGWSQEQQPQPQKQPPLQERQPAQQQQATQVQPQQRYQPRYSQYRSHRLYINSDTVLQGPSPTDTSRNAVNPVLQEFYSNYPSDMEFFVIPEKPEDERMIPALDFRQRPVRDAWPLLVLAVLTVVVALMVRFFRKDLKDLLEGFVSNRLINQTIREPGLLNTPLTLLLLILSSLAFGALLYTIIPRALLPFDFGAPQNYLLLSGMTLLLYLFRICFLKLTDFVFGIREFVNSYLYILYTATGTFSLLIILILLVRLLGPPQLAGWMIPVMQASLLLFFSYQYIRGTWYLSKTFQFPKIYLILYLCAFEICPLLILGMGLFNS